MEPRAALLALHHALVEEERREQEKTLGRLSGGEFLQALISDPVFAWLRPLTTLIVRLDEAPDADVLAVARRLFSEESEFRQRATALVQRSPEVAFAYAAAKNSVLSTK
jgi:hypothetical protein